MHKICTRCKLDKLLTEFYNRKDRKPDSKIAVCKTCSAERRKEWARKNPDRMRVLQSRWLLRHPDYIRHRRAKYRKTHRELGLCEDCASLAMSTGRFCRKHYIQHLARCRLGVTYEDIVPRLENKWQLQKGLCFYSGVPLTLGVNASLDHVMPQSRFEETKSDIDNLVWTDEGINRMKGPRTDKEFIALCRQIVAVADLRK